MPPPPSTGSSGNPVADPRSARSSRGRSPPVYPSHPSHPAPHGDCDATLATDRGGTGRRHRRTDRSDSTFAEPAPDPTVLGLILNGRSSLQSPRASRPSPLRRARQGLSSNSLSLASKVLVKIVSCSPKASRMSNRSRTWSGASSVGCHFPMSATEDASGTEQRGAGSAYVPPAPCGVRRGSVRGRRLRTAAVAPAPPN